MLGSIWTIDREYKSPTMIKNQNELRIKLVEKIIQYSSNTGDKVMDMFLDEFTKAKLALKLNKGPLRFEINKKHKNI
jgi:DNA modification methylase